MNDQTLTRSPLAWIERLWSSIADRGRPYADVPAASDPPLERARQLADSLLSSRGEASGAAIARELLRVLDGLGQADRLAFCRQVSTQYLPDAAALAAAASAYLAAPTPANISRLADTAEPPRQELLRRINHAQGGTAALVALRKELLAGLRTMPDLAALDSDLRHLFASWFNRGFLELRRIDWNTPAAVLEKLIVYEAVHEIDGWSDLRRRLAADRRCFAFFHPALPGEPLIFVEVALVKGLADAVQPLLAPDTDEAAQRARAAAADTAIFYSISNCQDGLRGISFGNFLIKQVVEELKAELPQLTRFATLSPVPGFRRWVAKQEGSAALPDDAPEESRRDEVMGLCARYLTESAADPVARFHLGNGARLERINWRGNIAPRGLAESAGIMVNYLYDPDTIEANHEAFARAGHVARATGVDALIAPKPRVRG
jgi:malonyl-CoA decarboxylase